MKSLITFDRVVILGVGLMAGMGIAWMLSAQPITSPGPAATAKEPAEAQPGENEPRSRRRGVRKGIDYDSPSTPAEVGTGRWRKPGQKPDRTTESNPATIEQLESIGYAGGGNAASGPGIGVVVHDPERAFQGLNLYSSGHAPGAVLLDMDGAVLHRWHMDFPTAFPNNPKRAEKVGAQWWRRLLALPGGDLIVIFGGQGIMRLDRDSNLLWANPVRAHHDVVAIEDGHLMVLTRQAHRIERINPDAPILEDFVTRMTPDGEVLEEVSLLECVENSPYAHIWHASHEYEGDIFHTNSLQVLGGHHRERWPADQAGNWLISMPRQNAIAVIDPGERTVVWAMQGVFDGQHDATLLDNGNLLLFDNRGFGDRSTVMEFDPVDGAMHWEYRTPAEDSPVFLSKVLGASERLPNGNTLITESDAGRAFEVTPDHEVVWDFHTPHRTGDHDEFLAVIPDVIRLPADYGEGWLSR